MKRIFVKIFKLEMSSRISYRGKLAADMGIQTLKLAAPLLTWAAVFSERAEVGGYSFAQMTTYLVIGNFIGMIFSLAHASDLGGMIKTGKLSSVLLRPISITEELAPRYVARSLFSVVLIVIPAIVVFGISGVIPEVNVAPMALLLIISNWILAFFFGLFIGALAFWITEMWAVVHLLRSLLVLAGGTWFPLDLLPYGMGSVLQYSPFAYMGYVSTQSLIGGFQASELLVHLGVSIIWTLVFWAAWRAFYRSGLELYESTGG